MFSLGEGLRGKASKCPHIFMLWPTTSCPRHCVFGLIMCTCMRLCMCVCDRMPKVYKLLVGISPIYSFNTETNWLDFEVQRSKNMDGRKTKYGRKATLEILNVIGSRGPCFSGQRYNLFHQRSSSSTVTVMFRLSQLTYFSCFPWYNRTRLWGMIFCVFTSTPVNICILLCCMTGMHIAVILTVACVTVGCAVRSISTTPPQVTW